MRVDFYILKQDNPRAHYHFACRLIEKAYRHKHTVYVHTENTAEAHRLDELLWTFRDESFIPHNLAGEGPTPPPPVQLGCNHEPHQFNDILINFAQTIPTFYQRFKRVIEIVPHQEDHKKLARDHYCIYRDQNCQLQSHNISASMKN